MPFVLDDSLARTPPTASLLAMTVSSSVYHPFEILRQFDMFGLSLHFSKGSSVGSSIATHTTYMSDPTYSPTGLISVCQYSS